MRKFLSKVKNGFITGLIVILPLGVTFWVLFKVLNLLDSILGKMLYSLIGMKIHGLGLLTMLVLVFVVGIIASNVIGKKVTKFVERLFTKVPIIKTIYSPLKDILKNFTNKSSNNFKKAVFVTYPMEESHSIGFITKENVKVGNEEKTVIFIPTTPNPTSGFLVYLSKDKYTELDIPVDVALKTIISLGSVSPDVLNFIDCDESI